MILAIVLLVWGAVLFEAWHQNWREVRKRERAAADRLRRFDLTEYWWEYED